MVFVTSGGQYGGGYKGAPSVTTEELMAQMQKIDNKIDVLNQRITEMIDLGTKTQLDTKAQNIINQVAPVTQKIRALWLQSLN
jgi:capsular polysaccharide biosynthesis protein